MPAVKASVAEDIRRNILDVGRVGSIEIRDAQVVEVVGSDDEPILRVSLTLSDPTDVTWPADDVEELLGRATDIANGVDVELPWVVVELFPSTSDDTDEALEDPDLARRLKSVDD